MKQLLEPFSNEINNCVQLIYKTIQNSGSVWVAGNGGSASTADHFEIDLLKIKEPRNGNVIKISSLTSNSSVLTAILNDIGSEYIFSKQLEKKSQRGDLVILISASGNSPNLVKAYEFCAKNRVSCVGILGFDGGILGKMLSNKIHVKSNFGDYALVENVHLAICHEISERVHQALKIKE